MWRIKRRDSVARLPTGPAQGSEPLGLKVRNHPNRITRRERLLQRSYRSQLENGPIRWARTSESNPLYTSVDASRPHDASADNAGKRMVEPPGIAPGSGPLITSAFIAIVRPKPDDLNIGPLNQTSKSDVAGATSRPSRRDQGLRRPILYAAAWQRRRARLALGTINCRPRVVRSLSALANRHANVLRPIASHDAFAAANDPTIPFFSACSSSRFCSR